MMTVGATTVDLDRAIEEVARDLVHARKVNGVWYVNLPSLYPDGSFVTVRIDQTVGGLRVSDAGFAYREADRLEASRSFRRLANTVAAEAGISVGERSIFVESDVAELERSIMDVAEASWRVADGICRKVWEDESEELPPQLKDRLTRLFGADHLQENAKIRGDSTSEWEVSAVVRFPDHQTVFQTVHDHANSVNKASTAFRDLSLLAEPPRLIAVVQSKDALRTRLPLLAPAKVLEERQSDELFMLAAA